MSYIISANLEPDVHAWIMQEQNESQSKNLSKVVNFYLRKAMNEKRKERPQLLSCIKHPGSVYSSKLPKCPICAEEETIKEIEGRDEVVKAKRAELIGEREDIAKRMQEVANKMNSLDMEAEGSKSKFDGLTIEFDKLRTRKDAITIELAEFI